MSWDPVSGGPCWVGDLRRGVMDDIARILKLHSKENETMSGNCYYCGGHPDEVVDLRRRRDELEAQLASARKLLQSARGELLMLGDPGSKADAIIKQIERALTDEQG